MRTRRTITIDALDAIEITEILEYLLEHIVVLAKHDLSDRRFADTSPIGLDDLRADITRPTNRLNTARSAP